MADGMFNIGRGRVNGYFERVAENVQADSAIVVVLLKAAEADATLADYDDLGAILAEAGNTEADFTNYARKVLTDTDVSTPTPDDTNNWQAADLPDQTWASAGGTLDNTMAKLLICFDPDTTAGTDADIIPLMHMDWTPSTDGGDLVAQFDSNGVYRAS